MNGGDRGDICDKIMGLQVLIISSLIVVCFCAWAAGYLMGMMHGL